MSLYPLLQMYREFVGTLRFKNALVSVFVIKLVLLWALFHYLYDNPYKQSPLSAPSAIAEQLTSHTTSTLKE